MMQNNCFSTVEIENVATLETRQQENACMGEELIIERLSRLVFKRRTYNTLPVPATTYMYADIYGT